MRCVSFCTAKNYRLNEIANYYRNQGYETDTFRNVLYLHKPKQQKDIFFFTHGCFVSWGFTRQQEQKLIKQIHSFSIEPLSRVESDHFIYKIEHTTKILSHKRFNIDIIMLETDNPQIKLAISYGISQSIKLDTHAKSIQETIKKNNLLPQELAQRGKIRLPRRTISKRMGEIFLARSSVNLDSEYTAMPEYFWEHPNLENYYKMTKEFLDIPDRAATLNQKLDVLHELFEMLSSHLEYRHSFILESIIILLIFIEIIISIFHFSYI